jgi:hypothetical protein
MTFSLSPWVCTVRGEANVLRHQVKRIDSLPVF